MQPIMVGRIIDAGFLSKKHWPHQLQVNHPVIELERWCYKNFKSRNWRNYGKYFAFKRQQDFEWFVLKWSS